MSKKKEIKLTASSFYDDVVVVLAEKSDFKAKVEVSSAEVIAGVLARRGITRDTAGNSESRRDKPRVTLLIEWAFRNQRAEHQGEKKRATAPCVQGEKRGMWALTEAGIAKAQELVGKPAKHASKQEPPPQAPSIDLESPYTAEELRLGVAAVQRIWERLVERASLQQVMKLPIFELTTRSRNWGFWNAQKRIFAIQARLAIQFAGTHYLQDTVAHELAHQYVSEVLQNTTERSHGPAWKSSCLIFGADPKATAKDRLDDLCSTLNARDEKVLRRVQKLMALSDSPEEHEAERAALQAQELMRKHQTDSLVFGDIGNSGLTPGEKRWDFKVLGTPLKQRPGWIGKVVHILQSYYQVQPIWLPAFHPNVPDTLLSERLLKREFVLEITGTTANVSVAAYVYDFLIREGERRLEKFQADSGKTNRTSRLDFLEGLYKGFDRKLEEQSQKIEAALSENCTALVVQDNAELRSFYEDRYPHTTRSTTRGRWTQDVKAREEGLRQGKEMNVREAINSTQGKKALASR